MVNIGGWSQELCGGTHVSTTGEIGSLRIINESAISAGTRRIEAVAGISAYKWTQERISLVQEITQTLACTPDEISSRIIQLQNKSKEQDKKLKAFQQKGQAGLADKLMNQPKVLGDIKIIKAVVPETSPNDLCSLAAQINKRTVPSVVLLVSEHNGKCGLVCICSDPVKVGHQAGKYLGELAASLGGKGGGKPDFAMGGLLPEKISTKRSPLSHYSLTRCESSHSPPPTLSGCVQRNAIPAKIEIEQIGGSRTPPEKIEPEKFAQLEEAERCALFALSQWCGGNVSSFMQLDQNQMGELLRILNGVDCFYLANDPGKKSCSGKKEV